MNYNLMSNAELNISKKEMENEYESLKNKIRECMTKMQDLDKKYQEIVSILMKRTQGKI